VFIIFVGALLASIEEVRMGPPVTATTITATAITATAKTSMPRAAHSITERINSIALLLTLVGVIRPLASFLRQRQKRHRNCRHRQCDYGQHDDHDPQSLLLERGGNTAEEQYDAVKHS
jgi:hypothetical protein